MNVTFGNPHGLFLVNIEEDKDKFLYEVTVRILLDNHQIYIVVVYRLVRKNHPLVVNYVLQ
jgi:hypothetical protein